MATASRRTDDFPTLRLVTLRRLVAGLPPPIVLDHTTELAAIALALRVAPLATVLLVDADNVLQGTVRASDLARRGPGASTADVMSRHTPILAAEDDIEAARYAMTAAACDRAVVISPRGELLGVVTAQDLGRTISVLPPRPA